MLSVENLGLARGGQMIVNRFNAEIESGWALQIHGANGSGKTTLLRLFAGLLLPATGSVSWHGVNVHTEPQPFRRDLAYVGHTNGVSDDLSVLENLRFSALIGANATSAHSKSATDEVLEQAGLISLQHMRLGRLSQGQRRRVALVRLMLERKPLWLLDEPADALDDAASNWLTECIAAHMHAGGIIVTTTHRPLPTDEARTRHLYLERSPTWQA